MSPRIANAAALTLLLLSACDDGEGKGRANLDDPFHPEDQATEQTDLPLVRRAALEEVETLSNQLPQQVTATFVDACEEATRITGQLDGHSNYVAIGSSGWHFDSYLFTALQTGRVSIASEAPVNSYFYPFTIQALQDGATQPALSADLVAGMALPDNAGGDGKARVDLSVEAGAQYLVTFKQLRGPVSSKDAVSYALSFCTSSLRAEGKLWISSDPDDVVRAVHLTNKLDKDNATPEEIATVAAALKLGGGS